MAKELTSSMAFAKNWKMLFFGTISNLSFSDPLSVV